MNTIGRNVVFKVDGKLIPLKKRGKYYYKLEYVAECKKCGIKKRIDSFYLNNPNFNKCQECKKRYNRKTVEVEFDIESIIKDREDEAAGKIRKKWRRNIW